MRGIEALELFPPSTLDLDLLQLRSDCANDARSNLLTGLGVKAGVLNTFGAHQERLPDRLCRDGVASGGKRSIAYSYQIDYQSALECTACHNG